MVVTGGFTIKDTELSYSRPSILTFYSSGPCTTRFRIGSSCSRLTDFYSLKPKHLLLLPLPLPSSLSQTLGHIGPIQSCAIGHTWCCTGQAVFGHSPGEPREYILRLALPVLLCCSPCVRGDKAQGWLLLPWWWDTKNQTCCSPSVVRWCGLTAPDPVSAVPLWQANVVRITASASHLGTWAMRRIGTQYSIAALATQTLEHELIA
ncbi:hypothetical protein F4778DRAFT_248077 [Xylariomycetidae sp. FL2044]|nr:hypothetical protein F4778DRAFT_248077 [Xylariomycetidae sp. FL2044]